MAEEGQRNDHVLTLLRGIAEQREGERVTIEDFSKGLGRRGYGLLLFALNLPNLIPLPLPVISMLLGLPLAFVGGQLAFGAPRPWLPKALLQKGVAKSDMLSFCNRLDERYGWVRKLVRARLPFLVSPLAVRLIGTAIFILACTMVLPIPLGNFVLAVPIALLSLALVEKDGVFVIAGLAFGVIGLGVNLMIGLTVLRAVFKALGAMLGG